MLLFNAVSDSNVGQALLCHPEVLGYNMSPCANPERIPANTGSKTVMVGSSKEPSHPHFHDQPVDQV